MPQATPESAILDEGSRDVEDKLFTRNKKSARLKRKN